MALIDEIRRLAESKDSYDPSITRQREAKVGSRLARAAPAPVVPAARVAEILSRSTPSTVSRAAGVTPAGVPGRTSYAARLGLPEPVVSNETPETGGGTDLKGLAGKAFMGIIDAVDTPRAAVVSSIKEATDILPGFEGGDGSFDVGDLVQNTRDNYGFGDLVEQVMGPDGTNRNIWLRRGLGFAGDVAADPLTYLTFGTVQAGKQAAKGAGYVDEAGKLVASSADVLKPGQELLDASGKILPAGRGSLDQALASGSRTDLAETIVQQAARRGIVDDAVDRLATEAGKRGRGAFTAKGLARADVDKELVGRLGLTSDLGYRVKVPGTKGINVKGSQRLAQASENLKGNMKMNLGGSATAKVFRRMFIGDNSALGQAERAFTEELITGAPNAAVAARGLAAIKLAKADSYLWMDSATQDAGRMMKGLNKLSKKEAAEITHAVEAGDLDDLSAKVSQWFEKAGVDLNAKGVNFDFRNNYVNHVLTEDARRAIQTKHPLLAKISGLQGDAAFQNARELVKDGEFLGEVLESGSIRELNQISNKVLGFDLFEDDIRVMMGAYLHQGQRQMLKESTLQHAELMGVAKQLDEVVDQGVKDKAVAAKLKEVQAAEAEELAHMRDASRARKQVVEEGSKVATVARRADAKALTEAEKKLDDAFREVTGLERKITVTEGKLAGHEMALRNWQSVLDDATRSGKKLQAKKKAEATREVKRLTKVVDRTKKDLVNTKRRLARASDPARAKVLKGEVDAGAVALQQSDEQMNAARAARAAMDDPSLPVPGTPTPALRVAQASKRVEKGRQQWLTENKAWGDASSSFTWMLVDQDSAMAALRNRLDQFDRIRETRISSPGVGVSNETVRLNRAQLRENTRLVLKTFDELGDEPTLNMLRNIEAQAAAHDMNAYRAAVTAAEARKQIDVLSDPGFQEHMTRVAGDGFTAINDKVQVPEFFDDAMSKIPETKDEWTALRKTLSLYDSGMNLWKGYATASPGFVIRNAYTGMFNMWLDGVSPKSVKRFSKYLHIYHRDGLDAAQKWAKSYKGGKFSPKDLQDMDDALGAAAASGWGLTPQEVESTLIGSKRSVNPLKADFAPIERIRHLSSRTEAVMRGAHAFDVLQRGGDVTNALARVEKFHFNYRDITSFDQAAKRVSPFWTFYSRNMALQADIWTRFPQKLNRSYFNLKRNMELGTDEEEVLPEYMREMGAIRTPFGEDGGGKWYLTPDLPSLRFRQDFAQLTGTGGEGLDPLRLLSDTGPAVKTPVQLIANRNLFTNIPFKNRLHEYDADGNVVGREAPGMLQGEIPFTGLQVPGAGQAIQQAANLLPGTEMVDGRLLMQDNTQSAVEDFVTVLGRQSRLDPNQPKYEQRQAASALSFLGAPVKQNTEQMIQGELYGRKVDAEEEARQAAYMEMIQGLSDG